MNLFSIHLILLLTIIGCIFGFKVFSKPDSKVAIKFILVGMVCSLIAYVITYIIEFLMVAGVYSMNIFEDREGFEISYINYLRLRIFGNIVLAIILGFIRYFMVKKHNEIQLERKYLPAFVGLGWNLATFVLDIIYYSLFLGPYYTSLEDSFYLLLTLFGEVSSIILNIVLIYIVLYAVFESKNSKPPLPSLLISIGIEMFLKVIGALYQLVSYTIDVDTIFLFVLVHIVLIGTSIGAFFFAYKFWIPNREKFIKENDIDREELEEKFMDPKTNMKEEHGKYYYDPDLYKV